MVMKYRWVFFPLIFLLFLYFSVLLLQQAGIKVVYQNTKSMPVGYYFIYPMTSTHLNTGEVVLIKPKAEVLNFLIHRKYIEKKMPLLKVIKAGPGDYVCYKDKGVMVNYSDFYPIYHYDKQGKVLPKIDFCSTLKSGEYFVVGQSSQYSFDSRYFGIIQKKQIMGKAIQL